MQVSKQHKQVEEIKNWFDTALVALTVYTKLNIYQYKPGDRKQQKYLYNNNCTWSPPPVINVLYFLFLQNVWASLWMMYVQSNTRELFGFF